MTYDIFIRTQCKLENNLSNNDEITKLLEKLDVIF